MALLHRFEDGRLNIASTDWVRSTVQLVLSQVLTKIMLSQASDGSWGRQSCEITAYASLTLSNLEAIPWATSVRPVIQDAISAA